jgi:small ligand-binding sensory domain FIST
VGDDRSSRVGAGFSDSSSAWTGAVEAARSAREGVGGRTVDLAYLFVSPQLLDGVTEAVAGLREELAPRHLVGCVAEGVVGVDREAEQGPATAVWAASLPPATIEPFHLSDADVLPDLTDASLVTMLVDPFSFPLQEFLEQLNADAPGVPVVGGIAVGGGRPGSQALVLDDAVHGSGAVGVAISGTPVRAVVSQGCAPFGREAVITHAEENLIYELAGERALDRLRAEVAALPPERQELAARGVLAGLVIDENKSEYGRGDFLMRGIVGADSASGALAVGDHVRPGQTLRFHFRDAATADDDLRGALVDAVGGDAAAGALLFTCNGRGTNMFPEPHHDARAVNESAGTAAVAGFFCGGELGPVGGRIFLHGFTATLAVFL